MKKEPPTANLGDGHIHEVANHKEADTNVTRGLDLSTIFKELTSGQRDLCRLFIEGCKFTVVDSTNYTHIFQYKAG